MEVPEAEEKVREIIIEIRKVFTNKKWCQWADAWLSQATIAAWSRRYQLLRIWRAAVPLQRQLQVDLLLVELSYRCPPETPPSRQRSSPEAVVNSINSPP